MDKKHIAFVSILALGIILAIVFAVSFIDDDDPVKVPPLEEAIPEGYFEGDIEWISDCEGLRDIEEDLDGAYALEGNIDCSETQGLNDGKGFEPIGEVFNEFTGVLLGRGHSINNLYINRPEGRNIGLFAVTDDATIKNIRLEDSEIRGYYNVGSLIARNQGESVVENSYSTGTLTGEHRVGGLVGSNSDASVSNSYSAVEVTGNERVGGLIGYSYDDTKVVNSYATGTVEGDNEVGGLIGRNSGNAEVLDSYAVGDVIADDYWVGGLVGYQSEGGSIRNSYAIGRVTGERYVGGLIGVNHGDSYDSFWDTETSNTERSDGGTGLTTTEMQTRSTFERAGWNFEDTWYMDEYPDLQWNR